MSFELKPKIRRRPVKIRRKAGSLNVRWKGGEILRHGRMLIYSPEHPYPTESRYVLRARLVMERFIKRFLLPGEVVHHRNGDTLDDGIENLELMSWIEHNRLHARTLKTAGRWSWKYEKCTNCGTTEQRHKGHGLCTRCNDRKRWPRRRKNVRK